MQNFVILANQRSGSTLLTDLLGSHGDITCYGEVIHAPGYHKLWSAYMEDKEKTKKKAHGFKLAMNFIDPLGLHWFLSEIKEMDYKVVLLLRKNKFLQGIFQRASFEWVGDQVRIKRANFIERIEMFIEYEKKYSELADIIFTYEDMTNGENISEFKNEKIRESLLSILGVDDQKLTSDMQKNNRNTNSKLIINYEEIADLEQKYGNHMPTLTNLKKNTIMF
jgi:hypothetical protein